MVVVFGISHKSAPVHVREVFAFDEQEKPEFFAQVRSGLQAEGMVIVSTCNRTEIYFSTLLERDLEVLSGISTALTQYKGVGKEALPSFYFHTRRQAVEQLFKVTSGLDSLVLGEEQILVQIKEAFRNAQHTGMSDCITSRLFIKAIEAGKRVRTETHLGKGAASVGHAAVELSRDLLAVEGEGSVLLVGAGQTGELIANSLSKKGHMQLCVANRTFEKAAELAGKYNGRAIRLEDIGTELHHFDIIFTATSSKEHLIGKDMAAAAVERHVNHRQVYIDLSVPTNVDEQVQHIAGIRLFGVDDLEAVVHQNVERRKTAVDHSMEIIGEVRNEFMEWLDYQNLTPTIISIKENLKFVQQAEAEGFIRHRKIMENELIEQFSEHISEKYAQKFIKKLKQVTDNGKNTEYIRVINELFELTEHE
jgi:glutamyl-tRNA reductase